ncbi:parasitic phase-specific protein psp-1 [Colletotrichum truncatum]|uniref:Parasitic phase-specific protein psp-1 n=1 Tax=Colletotrichum truncatum TaxID=5467 RepID=A0ACC3ZKB4_COLTU|nr:parasitic phase-specific protein psp-1 [Colletotrichum truncatum]KAF6799933.1 parasitic phase-specific protein psp-1 [Colletotrichum truncatum]
MADMALPDGLVAFGPNANCTLNQSPLEWSLLRYKPSIPANVFFLAAFGLCLAIHIVQGFWLKTWGFLISMACGCIMEIVGYIGRILLYDNPFGFPGFLMQIICITIAPVFYCAAIYVVIAQTIVYLDASISRFQPRLLYQVFIPCDIISLILQAIGGALSVVADSKNDIHRGEQISLAGLIFQVVALGCFTIIFVEYLYCFYRSTSNSILLAKSRLFLGFLLLAVLFILIRCVYRIIELKEGYFSEIFRDEPLFIALESCLMLASAFCLNIGHPGLFFPQYREIKGESTQYPLVPVKIKTHTGK